ncbi:hypothetical protein D9758_010571 [Tetrapyrgos nigripes]|uniref:Glycosyltransferase 2-like domain-containing protein n=1 Tax=Tetrapyrgos nigripes TaxID=182062 RepID=A0A8H5FYW0_9AGAR|nr:hypothetical protein D9758_010571 [Tetrapyrgos nigripes]
MDYDNYDAIIHYIWARTQNDAWFKPTEDNISAGVCLRVDQGQFRVFPYENKFLVPFEAAVRALNPLVAVKVRSAAVHAALANVTDDAEAIYLDLGTRIQVLETISELASADKEQCGAFVRDERILVVWSDDLDTIIDLCQDFETKLMKFVWRCRTNTSSSFITSGSIGSLGTVASDVALNNHVVFNDTIHEKTEAEAPVPVVPVSAKPKKSRSCWSWRLSSKDTSPPLASDVEKGEGYRQDRPIRLFAPFYGGLGAALSVFFVGSGVSMLLQEQRLDGTKAGLTRFALLASSPLLLCVSLFFALQVITNISFIIGPVAQYHENSRYYSAVKPGPVKELDGDGNGEKGRLPHITIELPVYKESLEETITPSVISLKKAMQTYARQGGTSSIFVHDDGLQLISSLEREKRIAFYANHGIGWVARPPHGSDGGVEGGEKFVRAGRFKKASNMNYGLALSLRMEEKIRELEAREGGEGGSKVQVHSRGQSTTTTYGTGTYGTGTYGGSRPTTATTIGTKPGSSSGLVPKDPNNNNSSSSLSLEDQALQLAIEEIYEENGKKWKPWACNARALRVGEVILIVDSDTIVPEDCFRDAARELYQCPDVAIIQHESDVMQVAHHYFENGISHFTRRINKCISMGCANGEVAPFVGHNAFLKWSAIQDAAFVDVDDPVDKKGREKKKIWSESNVSEDFDMALRLQIKGYIIRWATYSEGGFKEGVSLTVDDELNRWQKYACGCNELMFNPLISWWRLGPITKQLRIFIWSSAPVHYKITMMAYMFSYYGIAASAMLSLINYFLLGWAIDLDGYYMHSFEIWLACLVVFPGAGNVAYTVLEYRLGQRNILSSFLENVMWIPFFFFFFGGLSVHLSTALLAHLFSYNITWGATTKEVERSNFFLEVPKIWKRYWPVLIGCFITIAGMIVLSLEVIPAGWRIPGTSWAVILPLALVTAQHVVFPIVLNPWLMIFSY